ncbi:trehalase family glycosidase, partial [Escherichia coli]
AASGWDFSSRWMDNPQQLNTLRTTSIVPVDLNSLMFKMEKILARASKAAGDNAMANQYETLANARQKGIEKYLWNDQQGWYADYDLKSHKVRNQLTAAALFPLYVNAAAKDRANKMATATKKLVEKYDVSATGTGGGGGEYPLQDGFGWTNGVTLKMLDLICPKEQPCDNVPATRPLSESTTQPLKQKEAEPTP